jgi:hypothetical protein
MMRARLARTAIICAVALSEQPLAAQGVREPAQSAADVAIAQGRLDAAETALFGAASRAPHEPSARGALGNYLASRGRLRVGAVLLEEARKFGGDSSIIDARLARIYAWLGDWAAVAALRRAPISSVEHDRVRWLASHAPAHSGPDSVVVALEPNELAGFGRIALSVGHATFQADIDPNIDGLVLPSTVDVNGESQLFGMHDSAVVAAVRAVEIGALHFTNVRARLAPAARPAIGFDVLAALTPTFDPRSRTLTLRTRAASVAGEPLPFLLAFPGVKIVSRTGEPPVGIETAAGRAALRGGRWTFDMKRGAIVVER